MDRDRGAGKMSLIFKSSVFMTAMSVIPPPSDLLWEVDPAGSVLQ